MPADKDAAKRRRQARNRQERTNRQARTEGAKRAATRPSRTADARGDAKAKGTTTSLAKDGGSAAPAPGGLLGKLFPPRPDAGSSGSDRPAPARRRPPPSTVVEIDDEGLGGARRFVLRASSQPGGRAVLLAVLVAVVSAVVMLVSPIWPVEVMEPVAQTAVEARSEVQGLDEADAEAALDSFDEDTEPVYGQGELSESIYPLPIGVALALLPFLLSLIAMSSLAKPTRSRTLLWCALGGAFVGLFGGGGTFALPVAAILGWAAWQSRRADQAAAVEAD